MQAASPTNVMAGGGLQLLTQKWAVGQGSPSVLRESPHAWHRGAVDRFKGGGGVCFVFWKGTKYLLDFVYRIR